MLPQYQIFDETLFPFAKMKDINNPHISGDIAEGTLYSFLIIPSSSPKGTETPAQQDHSELPSCPKHLILLTTRTEIVMLFLQTNMVCKPDQNLEYTNPRPL